MKKFIVTDNKKIVGKVLKRLELADRKDDKLTVIKLKVSMNGYKNLAEKEIFNLSIGVQDFFHLIYSFGKKENITNFVNVWTLEDPIQMETTITCRPFQLYFYGNWFFPDKRSKMQSYKKLTNVALGALLKRTFYMRQRKQ